jgi:pimeloyl-ACP methyl ester carboxylesterase
MGVRRKWRKNVPSITNTGVRIHYETVGRGPPIILVHGGLSNSTAWKSAGIVDGLRGYRCILVDRRGYGLSEKPRNVTGYGMEEQVSDIVAVLDALRIRRAIYWGHSNGGYIGFAMVARHPDRVAAFIASGAGSKYLDEQFVQWLRDEGAQKFTRNLESEEGVAFPPWLWKQFHESDFEVLISECSEFVKWGGERDALPRIQTPTLILVGSKEDSDRESEEDAKRLQNGRAIILEGLGHVGVILRPDLSLPVVKAFLKEVGVGHKSS